jgi:hypothetical protein
MHLKAIIIMITIARRAHAGAALSHDQWTPLANKQPGTPARDLLAVSPDDDPVHHHEINPRRFPSAAPRR